MEKFTNGLLQEQEKMATVFIAKTDLERAPSPYIVAVREAIHNNPEQAFPRSYVDVSDDMGDGGYGFLAPSFHVDASLEVTATAAIAKAMQESEKKPLIVTFDEFYRDLARKQGSIVGKMKVLKALLETRKERYGVIVTGMSESTLFSESALNDVPTQQTFDRWLQTDDDAQEAFARCRIAVSDLFLRQIAEGALPRVDSVLAAMPKADRDLLFATLILSLDQQLWQDLWWEGQAKKGPTLFIIAPTVFHAAMVRFNQSHGHGHEDYLRRATYLSSGLFSPADRDVQPELSQGVSLEEFQERVGAWMVKLAKELGGL